MFNKGSVDVSRIIGVKMDKSIRNFIVRSSIRHHAIDQLRLTTNPLISSHRTSIRRTPSFAFDRVCTSTRAIRVVACLLIISVSPFLSSTPLQSHLVDWPLCSLVSRLVSNMLWRSMQNLCSVNLRFNSVNFRTMWWTVYGFDSCSLRLWS